MIQVPLIDLKSLTQVCGRWCRNFKSAALAPLLLAVVCSPALAQAPKAVKTVPVTPAGAQTPLDTAKAMQPAERTAIQSDLAWTGAYNGNINGEASERMINAIKAWQKDNAAKQTGVLNSQEREKLAAAAKKLQTDAGWRVAADPAIGVRLGIPTKLAPQMGTGSQGGTKWSSAQGHIQIETWRMKATSIAAVAEREKNEPAGRKVEYNLVRPDIFVLSGMQGQKKFYVRAQISGDEVRGLSILYDQATESTMAPVVIAMSSAFAPFPAGAQAAAPPPRRKVEYATGIVVSADGAIVTDRQAVEGCQFIVVPGHGNADRVAEDKARELALLRIYGARDLKPIVFASAAAKPNVVLTGIADPQNQGGGAAVTNANAALSATTLTPAPAIGFAGSAAVDGDGVFAGMAMLKPAVVAGTPSASANEAALVPADQLREFLKANGVDATSGQKADAKASVLRVVCVRK